jgi:Thioesterase-like superfamily
MGRTGGLATHLRDGTAPESSWPAAQPRHRRHAAAGHVGVVPRWAPTSLSSLLRALDLRPVGPQRFEMAVAERQWPAFPSAQLAAAAVVAAERCFPGYSIGHLACAFGQPAKARAPLGIVMTEVRVGPQRVTGRLEFAQGGVGHGEATVVLHPGAADAHATRSARTRRPGRSLDAPADVTGLQPPLAWLAPWELKLASVSDTCGTSPTGSAQIWSRLVGDSRQDRTRPGGTDGSHAELSATAGRALLAYLSEVLPLAAAAAPSPGRTHGGPSSNVLSHAITYSAPFELRDWLMATVDSRGVEQGYLHARATFSTASGRVAAMVSQAAAIRGARCAASSGEDGKQNIA